MDGISQILFVALVCGEWVHVYLAGSKELELRGLSDVGQYEFFSFNHI